MALFKVFYGTKQNIFKHDITNGSIYISTDTFQKFADFNNQRVQISDQYMNDEVQEKIQLMKRLLNLDLDVKPVDLNLLSSEGGDGLVQSSDDTFVYNIDDNTITLLKI